MSGAPLASAGSRKSDQLENSRPRLDAKAWFSVKGSASLVLRSISTTNDPRGRTHSRYSSGWLVLTLFLACMGCDKTVPKATVAKESEVTETVPAKTDACALITKDEVARVQGAEITTANGSKNSTGELLISQCYYSARESSKSVSFTVTERDPQKGDAGAVEESWEETFGRFKDGEEVKETEAKKEEKGKRTGREEEEKESPPQAVADLGEEAYWAGSRFSGALYVLKKQTILRISVGGPGDPPAKLERSKALAQDALKRL